VPPTPPGDHGSDGAPAEPELLCKMGFDLLDSPGRPLLPPTIFQQTRAGTSGERSLPGAPTWAVPIPLSTRSSRSVDVFSTRFGTVNGLSRPGGIPAVRGAPGDALPGGPADDRAARAGAQPGGLPGPVDARRQPGQVAPGAYDLVLRDLHPRAS